MPPRPVFLLLSLLLCLAVAPRLAASETGTSEPATSTMAPAVRVLFVGNSHTSTNNLPLVVARLARQQGVELEVGMLAEPGHSLGDHLSGRRLPVALRTKEWDWVVMQQGPSSLPESRADLVRSATAIAVELHGRPTRIALLSVWPHRRYRASSLAAEASYRQAATAIDACVLPAATAWRFASTFEDAPRLYQRDQLHATRAGTVLTALTVLHGLVGESRHDLSAMAGDASPSDAPGELDVLRAVARRAHLGEPRRCTGARPEQVVGER